MSAATPTWSVNSTRCMSRISRRTLLAAAAIPLLAETDYRIIDPHVHVWKHDPQYPFAEGANVPARDAPPEMLLDLTQANGVARTVIIQVIHYRYDNSYLDSVLKRYPGTFQGVCRVDHSGRGRAPIVYRNLLSRDSAACASAPPPTRAAIGSTVLSCRRCGSAAPWT